MNKRNFLNLKFESLKNVYIYYYKFGLDVAYLLTAEPCTCRAEAREALSVSEFEA